MSVSGYVQPMLGAQVRSNTYQLSSREVHQYWSVSAPEGTRKGTPKGYQRLMTLLSSAVNNIMLSFNKPHVAHEGVVPLYFL